MHTAIALTIKMNVLLFLFMIFLSSIALGFTTPHPDKSVKIRITLGMTPREKLTNEEISRYSRHLVLGDVGMKGQTDIKNASVLVIGAGGLGSPCLMYLAAAGVGYIGIVDADVVDESNLQRQIIHGTSTINISKCQSAKDRITDINPNVHVRTYEEEFTSATAMRILGEGFSKEKKWDVVVDGSDNFPTKYLINDACEILDIPWVYSAILAFEGQLSVFNYRGGPNYRDMMPLPPAPGDVPSCAEGGVLGVLPGVCGCLQATEVLKIILGKDMGLLSGRLLKYDALTMTFSEARVEKAPDRDEITELIDYQGFCAGPKTAPQPIDSSPKSAPEGGRSMDEAESADNSQKEYFSSVQPKEAFEKLMNGWAPWVLDVRLQTEHDIIALPFTDMVAPHRTCDLNHIPVDGDILVYCKAGVRGKKACIRLIELGVDPNRLFNLDGGIMRWRQDVDPTMPKY